MNENGMDRIISLNGRWLLRYDREEGECPASPDEIEKSGWTAVPANVPGNVEIDLVRAGKLPEPTVGHNVYELRELESCQWWYSRYFATPELASGERAELVFNGLDCLGTIWLNRQLVGQTDNMLIPHRFDVTGLLQEEGNELVVRIKSAVLAGRRYQHTALNHAQAGKWEGLPIRKAAHMYGWDIMPRVVSAGLWRDVQLIVRPATHWRSVYWATLETDVNGRTARVMVDWDFATDRLDIDDLCVRLTLLRQGRIVHESDYAVIGTHDRKFLNIEEAEFWWPRGYGEPALYQGIVELVAADGTVLDIHQCHLGLRTVALARTEVTTPTEPGEFQFVINGEKIFVKGTNWVPLDALHSRDQEHLLTTFMMLIDLNCNMVRCWGGNVYEDHTFFDLCDEHGIMVWQDFSLACASYPQDEVFLDKIRREAAVIIPRLRNHPSLVLWAGNNENDEVFKWISLDHLNPNHDRISREILAEAVRNHDPIRPYLPSSPYYSPENFRRGYDMHLLPETHLWGPRGYFKDPFYTDVNAQFVSEIGYHGCPFRASLEQMLDPDYLWPWQDNEQWLTKATRLHPHDSSQNYRDPINGEPNRPSF